MANRPVFVPMKNSEMPGVKIIDVEFQWFPGMATSQKRKSIKSLHNAVRELGVSPVLEVSSKSEEEVGVSLSAFNLMIETANKKYRFSVESAFQASKTFERGGPYVDLLNKSSKEAKRDIRLKESGSLTGFKFFGKNFPIKPITFFYDWLYINALNQNKALADRVMEFSGFSDIEFNPKKSLNCQARSLALYISLVSAGVLEDALSAQDRFFEIAYRSENVKGSTVFQASLL